MKQISVTPEDWCLLEELAKRSGIARERVSSLRHRWERGASDGAPLTLLAGNQKALELFLARWLGVDAARALQSAGRQPLVIGATPSLIQPPLGAWPGFTATPVSGHLVVLAASEALLPSMAEALGSLGIVDQTVLVSFIDQPYPSGERKLAESLASLAAVGKTLVVTLPSHEITQPEADDTAALGQRVLESAGFDASRFGGGRLWCTEDDGSRSWNRGKVEEFLKLDGDAASSNKGAVLGRLLHRVLLDVEASASTERAGAQLDDEEKADAIQQFKTVVMKLGKSLEDRALAQAYRDSDALRADVMAQVTSWMGGKGMEAAALNYLESIRPGVKSGVRSQMEAWSASLELVERPEPGTGTVTAPGQEKKRGGFKPFLVGLAAGTAGYAVAHYVGGLLFLPWLQGLLSAVIGALCAVSGWMAAGLFSAKTSGPRSTAAVTAPPSRDMAKKSSPLVPGWLAVEQAATAWITRLITEPPATVAEQCVALRSKLQLEHLKLKSSNHDK